MIGRVYFNDKDFVLRFSIANTSSIEKSTYPLGGSLCDFTAIKPQISEKLFNILGKKFVKDVSNRIDTPTIGAYVPFLRKAIETNPYLFLYLKFYAECLVQSCSDKTVLPSLLKQFLSPEIQAKYINNVMVFGDAENTSVLLGEIICDDLEFRIQRTKTQIERIVEENSDLAKYSTIQRVFIIRNETGSGLNKEFKMNIASEYDFEPTVNIGTIKASLIDNPTSVSAEYDIDTPDDLIALEMFHTVKENLPIKKCGCCLEYFVPIGRSDSEYCSRISPGEDKKCAQIGAMKTFKKKFQENPIYIEYNRAYKRNHSKLRSGKLYDSEFKEWSAAARDLRDKYIENDMDIEEFKQELKKLETE